MLAARVATAHLTVKDDGNAGFAGDVWTPLLIGNLRYKVKSITQINFYQESIHAPM